MAAIGNNVYILGAGFSSFANMPCIDDFLGRMRDLRDFSDVLSNGGERAVNLVLEERSRAASVREKVQLNLDNIEQLFSLIDATTNASTRFDLSPSQKAIRKAISATLLGSRTPVKLMNCTVPLSRRNALTSLIPGSETIQGANAALKVNPYTLFAATVVHRLDDFDAKFDTSDTIISFNYDMILEEAFRLLSVNPDYMIPDADYPDSLTPDAKSPKFIKLHGSINWGQREPSSNTIRIVADPHELVDEKDNYPVLLPPTWNKSAFVQTLGILWTKAIDALRAASRIILIGYSMPDTDTHFKYFLASGLRDNSSLRSFMIVNPMDLSSQCSQFFDKTYFSKRLITLGVPPGMRGQTGAKFEDVITTPYQYFPAVGRISFLLND